MSQSEPTTSSDVLHEKYEQITRDGADLADRPKDARAWLIAFANFAPGTQVSLNLITRDSKSLLPVLTSWLWIWAQRTQVARKQARSANAADDREKMMAMQYHGVSHSEDKLTHMQIEEKNLAWLFNYIFDYLGLDHDSIPPSDLGSLCDVLLHICQSTTVIEDIEESINITYGILQKWDLPQDALEPVLDVLCNTRMSLSRSMPSHLIDCIKLLVTGDLSQSTMNYLESSITKISTSETTKKSTALARGSVLFLGDVIKEKNRSGLLVVHFPDLIEPLSAAGGTAAPRLCTDILDFCDHMLLELDIRATILDSFAAFMGIVGDCALITKAKAAARLSHVSDGEHTIKIDESDLYQHANIVSTTRVKERLVGMWKQGSLDDKQQVLLYEFLIDTPEDTDESTLTFLLHHVEERKLCYPDKPGNKTQIHRLVKHLIQNKDVPSQVRRKAVDVIDEAVAVTTKDNNSPDAMSSSRSSGLAEVIGEWLNQLKSEENPAVAKHIANSLQRIAIKEHDEKSSLAIIMGLETMVLQKDPAQTRPTTLVAATQTLANIVLQSPRPEPSFRALLKIANIECNSIEARVEGLRFLFRLRCDSDGVVYIQSHADSQYIAAALCRTRESSDSFSITDNVEFERKSASSASLSTKSNTSGAGWMYPDTETYCAAQKFAHEVVTSGQSDADNDDRIVLDMGSWLITMAECLQRDQEWETYSYLIVHAGAQLSNTRLFSGSDKLLETVVKFRQVLCERIVSGKLIKPPIATGLKDSDVAICLFNVLTALNPYATIRAGPIQKGFADELVKAFLTGVGGAWEGTSRGCIHALSICCLEMPASVASSYPAIVDKMSKNMTQSHLSMHILEFLAQVARLPAVHSNFQDDEIMMIFSICVQFLERARERPTAHLISPPSSTRSGTPARQSGLSSRRPPYRAQMLIDLGLSHYNSALVYHVMIFWFLSLRLSVRARSIRWIIPRLVWKDRQGEEQIDEQSMVFIDMMQRTAYSDLGETVPHPEFANPSVDGKISSASWVVAQSIVTIETAGRTGLTQIIKRQASGTTHAVYQQHTAELPSHHVPVDTGIRPEEDDPAGTIEMLPSHVLLQMAATADPVSYRKQPVLLAKDDATRRAIQSLDRLVTIDSHKLGIMYIGPGQTLEKDYLANTSGTPDYHDFLEGMGRCVSLAPPLRFNPQGLQNIIDGTETYAWRDRVTEIVFHIPTMMPNRLEDDPGSTQKKSHVGNCHVNIIYNRSGLVWDFANFSSQLNYVNIVVEPANRPSAADNPAPTIDFYRVQTLTAPHFPQISPCSDPKIISSTNLAQFVRLVALNANVFCQAWNVRDSDTEFPSTWRARLQAIKRLREKVVSKEKGTLAQQLDFSGFTLS